MKPSIVGPLRRMRGQAGFGLLDLMIGVGIMSGILIFAGRVYGVHRANIHVSALALEAALSEARSIATMQQADATDAGLPTGATVSVFRDPLDAQQSVISVYRSRPIKNPNRAFYTTAPLTLSLPPDTGFPERRVAGSFTIDQRGVGAQDEPFTILISSSGYTSVEPHYAYVPGGPIVRPGPDPGCSDAGTTIAVASGPQKETHPFNCRNASYDASVML